MTRNKAIRFAITFAMYRLRKGFSLVRTNKDGVAAVEFALILPLMLVLVLYIGTAELTTGLMANRKMTLVARTVADLIAQDDVSTGITNAVLDDVYNSTAAIMSPFATTSLKITASSLKFVPKKNAPSNAPEYKAMTVWSISSASATKRPCGVSAITKVSNSTTPTSTTMPEGLYYGGTIIVADVEFLFTPKFGGAFFSWSDSTSSITMKHTSYMKPRSQDEIAYNESTSPGGTKSMTKCDPAPPAEWD